MLKVSRRKPRHIEDQHQRALFCWSMTIQTTLGILRDHMFAVPNGGKRSPLEAAIMKGLGVTAGVSDIIVLIPAGGMHGMVIELKAPGGKPTELQRDFLDRSKLKAYHASWHDDWQNAAREILRYLRHGNLLIGNPTL